PTIEEMLKAGMHFGHRTSKWHPKMEPFIFTSRKGVHIIDLTKTQKMLN
ncbi:30S ribosomal protein S2, partial [Candidatus Falkowbacteria bacterium CG10_big_fil_rev_8_21_14_0_10_38_22]